jgi:phosphatidylglycerophosphate synthase
MLQQVGPYAANLLTALRLLLTPLFVVLVLAAQHSRAWGVLAVIAFAVAAASDVWDGRVARRFGSASSSGRVFDHIADIGFVLAALSTYVALGTAPWWVPAAVAVAFGWYAVSVWILPQNGRANPVGSRIGHLGGVCNYVLIGILVCNNSAGIQLLSAAVLYWFFLLVPIYSGLAILLGAGARLKQPTARSPVMTDC